MDEVQPMPESADAEQDHPSITATPSSPSRSAPVTKRQGWAIIILLCATLVVALVIAFVAATNQFTSPKYEQKATALMMQLVSPKYQYKTIDFLGSSPSRTGSGAFKYSSITPDAAQLNQLGAQGWSVAGTYLEMETAWPNFGNAKYVTGIQPNVRPQRLVLVLQRRLPAS